jgi:alkyl hydroperoxide reductase subunit AhpC/predicted Ser/Thr protein kinase
MTPRQALVGTRAPEFSLSCTRVPGSGRQHVALSDYLGRWLVLTFYPRDFSLVCPTELTALSARIEALRSRECDVLGVSTDSVTTHERWVATSPAQGGVGRLQFPLASDEDGEVCRAYGVYVPRQHIALRGLFIIDPNGVLQYEVVHNLSVGRRAEDVVRVLDALQTGGLCPSDWEPSTPTLDPTGTLRAGSMLGAFQIEAELGHGSFGSVYRAYDTLLERRVALKVFPPDASGSSETLLREARAAAALVHPHVCTVFSVDASEGVPMIVMEYLEGRPLSKLLADGPLDPSRAASIIREVALGMGAAHAQGIVHGDLKPANVLITDAGVAKILDFGLARRDYRPASTEATVVWEAPDRAGVSGTPSYMAPEQTRGQPVTPASDVFSLGLMLFEMLRGRKAVPGSHVLEVMRQIEQVQADRLAAEVEEPFRSILRQALIAEPQHRSITMAQIAVLVE